MPTCGFALPSLAAVLACIAFATTVAGGAPASHAAALEEAVQGLSAKSYKDRAVGVEILAATGHPRAIPILEALGNVPFLVIDDLGVQRDTDWEVEMLYNLVDARYTGQLLTFVTTNKNVEELKGLADGRIYSRFLEMCYIIHVQGSDYRQHAQKS